MPAHGVTPDVEVEWQLDALDLRPVERWLADVPSLPASTHGHAGRRRRGCLQTGAPAHRHVSGHRRLAHRPIRVLAARAPARRAPPGDPEGHLAGRRGGTASTGGDHRGALRRRARGPRPAWRRRTRRAAPAGAGGGTRARARPRGPHPAPSLRVARGRGDGRRDRTRRDRHLRGPGRQAGPPPACRSRGGARVGRDARTARRAAARRLRSPTGDAVEVRGRPPRRRVARPLGTRPGPHQHGAEPERGRGRLRRAAAQRRGDARARTGDPPGRGHRRAPRHAGSDPPPARRVGHVRHRTARARPSTSGSSSGGWPTPSAGYATSTSSSSGWPCWTDEVPEEDRGSLAELASSSTASATRPAASCSPPSTRAATNGWWPGSRRCCARARHGDRPRPWRPRSRSCPAWSGTGTRPP